MKHLKSFILGMLAIILFIPIVEQLCEIVVTFMEYIKGLVSKPVLKLNKELMELQNETQQVDTVAMGFQYNGDEEYYDDFDDDFEDRNQNKTKLGF